MKYMVPLWKWEKGYHPADEALIMLHFDPVYIDQKEISWIERLAAKLFNRGEQ
jgi:hypothetical protein